MDHASLSRRGGGRVCVCGWGVALMEVVVSADGAFTGLFSTEVVVGVVFSDRFCF